MNKQAGGIQKGSSLRAVIAAQCYGVLINIRCRPSEIAAISAHLPFGCARVEPTDVDRRCSFTVEAHNGQLFSIRRGSFTPVSSPTSLELALKSLQKAIHLCIAEHARNHVFVHAGVVVLNDRVLVCPGFSHAGKSTLVWHFVQAGAIYYSDEYAVFDEYGCVYPFALPIGLRLDDGSRRLIMPENVGTLPRKPELIVFARYRSGATWRPKLLPPSQSVMKLIRHSIAIRRNPALVLPALKCISLQSKTFVGTRGDPHHLLDWLASID